VFERTGVDLHVFCTCLNTFEAVDFHRGTHAGVPVLVAVGFSSALPPLFPPGLHEGQLYLDGGFSDNFPLQARLRALGADQSSSVLAVNAMGKMPEFPPAGGPLPLTQLANIILCKTITQINRNIVNHRVGETECAHYIVIECQSIFDPLLWEAFLFSDKGKKELFERGVETAKSKLETKNTAS
jgi:predicted acylesterase/phospholipase RssA